MKPAKANRHRFLSLFLPLKVGVLEKFKVRGLGHGIVEIEFAITLPKPVTKKLVTGELRTELADPLFCEHHGEQPGSAFIDGFSDKPLCLVCMKEAVIKAGGSWCK